MTFSPSQRWLVIFALGFVAWLLVFTVSLGLLPLEITEPSLARATYLGIIVVIIAGCFYPFVTQSYVAITRESVITGFCWLAIALTFEYAARRLVDGISPLVYAQLYAPYFLVVPATCIAIAYAIRASEKRRQRDAERSRPFRAIR